MIYYSEGDILTDTYSGIEVRTWPRATKHTPLIAHTAITVSYFSCSNGFVILAKIAQPFLLKMYEG